MADWLGWKTAGGQTFSAPAATLRAGDGGLHLFARGPDDLVKRRRFGAGSWDPWTDVPGTQTTPSGPAATTVRVDTGPLTDDLGELWVFVRNSGGTIMWNRHEREDAPSWGGWKSVPVGITPSKPAVVNGTFPVMLFARGTDDGIHYIENDQSWGSWKQVPGGGKTFDAPAAAFRTGGFLQNDRIHLVVRGTDDGLHHNVYDGDEWSGWSAIGGKTFSAPALTNVIGDVFEREEVHLVVRGTDNGLHHAVYDGDEWNGWSVIPGGGTTFDAPALTEFHGDLWLFVRGTDNAIHYNVLG